MTAVQDRGAIAIHGPPGSGKTALGHALLRHFAAADGYTPLILHSREEWRSHVGGDRKQVILLDSLFGEFSLDDSSLRGWAQTFPCMVEYVKSGQCLVIFVMYKHIWNEMEASGEAEQILRQFHVLDLQKSHALTKEEKTEMIGKYWRAKRLPQKRLESTVNSILLMDSSRHAFPWILKKFAEEAEDKTDDDVRLYFLSPHTSQATFLARGLVNRKVGRCLAAVLSLTMSESGDCFASLEKLTQQLEEFGFGDCCAQQVKTMAGYYKGTYMAGNKPSFCCRQLYDAAGLALGSSGFLPTLLKVCDVRFLLNRIQTDPADIFALKIGDDGTAMECLYERIVSEVLAGNALEICQLQLLERTDFLSKFEEYCLAKNCLIKVLEATDTKHNDILLYWSVLCSTPTFTDWCLSNMLHHCAAVKSPVSLFQRILFLYALLGESTGSMSMKAIRTALKQYEERPKLLSTVSLPLPPTPQRHTLQLESRCKKLYNKTISRKVVYLEKASLAIPPTLMSVTMARYRPIVQVTFPAKHWTLALRLLADKDVDEQDEEGNTYLHLAAEKGDVHDISIAVRSGASLTIENRSGSTPLEIAEIRRKRVHAFSRPLSFGKQRVLTRLSSTFKEACKLGDVKTLKIRLCYDTALNDTDENRNTPLHICCENGRQEAVLMLISVKADINAKNRRGLTPLDTAADIDIVDMLLKHGTNTQGVETGKALVFSLHHACRRGLVGIVSHLLQTGADVSAVDSNGETPFHAACEHGNTDILRLLLRHGCRVNGTENQPQTPLHVACMWSNTDAVEFLLDCEAGVNTADEKKKQTPLHISSALGHTCTTTLLLKHKAKMDSEDKQKNTPLLLACEGGHETTAALLLSHGAPVSSENSKKTTPLHAACQTGLHDIAEQLIIQGANVDAADARGETPLHVASSKEGTGIVEMLLRHGADVSIQDEDEQTALHVSCALGLTQTAEVLLSYYAYINCRDTNQQSPLYYATERGHEDTVSLLLQNGAELGTPAWKKRQPRHTDMQLCKDTCGDMCGCISDSVTPLHAAAMKGHASIIELLLAYNADVNATDRKHRTALHYASRYKHEDISRILKQHGANTSMKDFKGKTPEQFANPKGPSECRIEIFFVLIAVVILLSFLFSWLYGGLIGGNDSDNTSTGIPSNGTERNQNCTCG